MDLIPFDIKYRELIEAGEYKVVTRDWRLARIICWDRRSPEPIVALAYTPAKEKECFINASNTGVCGNHGFDDLFILVPDSSCDESKDKEIIRKMAEHFKSKTKKTWCNIPVEDIISCLERLQEQKPNIVEKLRKDSIPADEDQFKIEEELLTEDYKNFRSFISVKFASNARVIHGKRFAVLSWERFRNIALEFINYGKEKQQEQKPIEIAHNQFDGIIYGMQGHLTDKSAEQVKDERIRKALVSIVKGIGADSCYFTDNAVSKNEVLAYLERQKESAPIPDKFSGLKLLMLQYLQSAANRKNDAEIESDTDLWGRKILDYVWKCDAELIEQEPMISIEEFLGITPEEHNEIKNECIYGEQKEQQPAEQNEEDKNESIEIIFAGKTYKVYGIKELPGEINGYIIEDEPGHFDCITNPDKVLIHNLGDLKLLNNYKSVEWSEADKAHIESILHRMDVQGAGSPYGRLKEDIIWLKSLLSRLKPSDNWKPTEEQLNALYLASYGGELSSEDCLELNSLLIDLRKNYNL